MGAGSSNGRLVSFVDFAPTVLSLAGIDIPQYMQGRAFLGHQQQAPRAYIYACRDRMDPAPETIRAVRDKRFKYVRNYRPDLAYIGFIPYRNQQEIMQEILRLAQAGELGRDQWQFTATRKPLEELYDTENDPHEIHNLAADPCYFVKLAELRQAHERWTEETGDLGHISEAQLIKRLWPPDGVQPTTADPVVSFVSVAADQWKVTVQCASKGASIAYRLNQNDRWRLYTQPLLVGPGTTLRTKANRLGWKHSRMVTTDIQ
jgi:hypothetical protein